MITFFRILLVYAGFITFLHAIIPHVHHEHQEEHEHHHHHHEKSLFDILELAFHNSQSFGSTDSFTVDEDFNQHDFVFQEPLLIKWLREQQLFVYFTLSYQELELSSLFDSHTEHLRGPPIYTV